MCGTTSAVNSTQLPPRSVLEHITDVHCHPTDSRISSEEVKGLPIQICAERLFVPGDQLPKFWQGKEVLGTDHKDANLASAVAMAVDA